MSDLDLLHRKMKLAERFLLRHDNKLIELEKRVKKLEQAKTHFPMTESKHRALLNNCVDNNEAILYKREIEEGNLDGH